MIQLTENEKADLEYVFRGVSDRHLIRELLRRGRFRQYQAHMSFWDEFRQQNSYLDMIRESVLRLLAKTISDDPDKVYPAMLTESPGPRTGETILTADIILLSARKEEDRS